MSTVQLLFDTILPIDRFGFLYSNQYKSQLSNGNSLIMDPISHNRNINVRGPWSSAFNKNIFLGDTDLENVNSISVFSGNDFVGINVDIYNHLHII